MLVLFSHSQILKQSTDYYAGFVFAQSNFETVNRLLCHNICLTPDFAGLPLCFVLNVLWVLDIV